MAEEIFALTLIDDLPEAATLVARQHHRALIIALAICAEYFFEDVHIGDCAVDSEMWCRMRVGGYHQALLFRPYIGRPGLSEGEEEFLLGAEAVFS